MTEFKSSFAKDEMFHLKKKITEVDFLFTPF